MQNVYSSAFTVTCAFSHNLMTIHVKMDVFIGMLRSFLRADECVWVMENGSKIKIDSSVKSEKLKVKGEGKARRAKYKVISCELRVTGYGLRVTDLKHRA